MNIRALVNELPDLFIGQRVLHPVDDLCLIFPYNGAYALPTAFSVSHMDAENGIGMSRSFSSVKDLMEDLNADD